MRAQRVNRSTAQEEFGEVNRGSGEVNQAILAQSSNTTREEYWRLDTRPLLRTHPMRRRGTKVGMANYVLVPAGRGELRRRELMRMEGVHTNVSETQVERITKESG